MDIHSFLSKIFRVSISVELLGMESFLHDISNFHWYVGKLFICFFMTVLC